DARRIHRELLGGDLHERGLDALAELGLAGEHGHEPLCVDADPAVEERLGLEAARQLRTGTTAASRALRARRTDRERHHEPTARREQAPARDSAQRLAPGTARRRTRDGVRRLPRRVATAPAAHVTPRPSLLSGRTPSEVRPAGPP